MTFTTKALAAAVAFAASSSAFAFDTELANSGNSSMVLAVWDDVAQTSYVRDLGINYNDFLPSSPAAPQVFATDSIFANAFAGSTAANIRWAVVGGETSGPANMAITQANAPTATNNSALNIAGASMDTVLNLGNLGNGVAESSATSYRTDASSFNTGASANSGRILFGAAFAGVFAGTIGDTLSFVNFRSAQSPIFPGTTQTYADTFTLSANGTLSYGQVANNPVPVPAAVWLLGSALAGVAGVARRRG
jgi:hypothetical protein